MSTIVREQSSTAIFELSEKLMPNFEKFRKPKVYRLCGVFERKPDRQNQSEQTGDFVRPINPTYTLDSSATVFDQFEKDPLKRHKIIRNVVGVNQKTGDRNQMHFEDIVERPEFVGGILVVQPHEHGKFLFMECHPKNKSNKYRDQSKEPVFEAVEEAEALSVLDMLEKETMETDARSIALNATSDNRRAMAEAMKIEDWTSLSDKDLLLKLFERAKQHPKEFIMQSFNDEAKAKVQIRDAKKLEIVECFVSNRTWRFTDGEKESIVEYKEGEVPDDALFKFLTSTKGRSAYERMIKTMKSYL